jgi:hypothetical protein
MRWTALVLVLGMSSVSWADFPCPTIDPTRPTTALESAHLTNIQNAIQKMKQLLASGEDKATAQADPNFQNLVAMIACDYAPAGVLLIPPSSSFAHTYTGRTDIATAWTEFAYQLSFGDLAIRAITYADAIVMVEWDLTSTVNGQTTILINDGIDTYVAQNGRYRWQTLHLPM